MYGARGARFHWSRPGVAKTGPAAVPTKTGAASVPRRDGVGAELRAGRPRAAGAALSFARLGGFALRSEAPALFIGRCCAVSGAGGRKRLAGGDPP